MLKLAHRLVNDLMKMAEGSRYLKWTAPSLEAIDTFLARPATVTSGPPHVRGHMDLKRLMITVVFAVGPCALMGIYLYGWRVAAVIAVSYAFGVGTEGIFAGIRKEKINEGAFVTCILYPLILPPTIPLWMVAVGIVFGIVFAKEVFGGTGYNMFNPALVSRCFLYLCFPLHMTGSVWLWPYRTGAGGFAHWARAAGDKSIDFMTHSVDALTTATPASFWKTASSADAYKELPLSDMFLGLIPGCSGETCKLVILVGAAVLILTKVADWRLIVSPIIGAFVLSAVLAGRGAMPCPTPSMTLLAGGLLFGSVFMVTDPVTAPMLPASKWVYGTMVGVLTVLIRYFSGFPEGFMFAVLLMNTFAQLIDYAFRKVRCSRRRVAA